VIIHILVRGLPICNFSYELPCNWPIGHKWVRAEEYNEATCPSCKKISEAAFPPEPADTEPDLVTITDDEGDGWDYGWGGFV
jgi:hypothetical protein